ncbi:enoyl-CoA hydratase/isomerase family protein [Gulosibacter molinativorax]|uniref:3-hydroxyisobutyryl-CoA hydrolase n=1 Tax=Gulosibacter molinativorax TaxID=256821 RepID=A0ABT7C9U8_9MICO|nr:enoyl-CoA hydratase/isomerase family protein [Gulosibacter molinativorax]MDJ1371977.1 enoyl-CoA hydratase/isomerase family protein [Gulosibacter molinativorax]QUY62659.1 Enoyl-CoA hydratase [Gulosibacter molinativorax]
MTGQADAYNTTLSGQVLFERRGPAGQLGVITLNRPRQLNSLSHAMIREITSQLAAWEKTPEVKQYLLIGAGERGLCAGGDILEIRADVLGTGGEDAAEFFANEYRLDAATGDLAKPYVAIMDGYTFGGGVGLSAHSKGRRVVTERSQIAMPETAIGFVPDVGGTYLLANMPGETGIHAGLTGARLDAGDAIATGFADHFVSSERLAELVARLESEAADALLAELSQPAPESPLLREREWIDEVYAAETPAEILSRLDARAVSRPAAAAAAKAIRASSPTAIAVTLEVIRSNRTAADLRSAIDLEYRAGMRLCVAHDFLEGVRAQVLDKDRNPQWQPATLDEVDRADVDAFLSPVEAKTVNWGIGAFAI